MKKLLFKLGQYLTARFGPTATPKDCKCHIEHRACYLHYRGDLESDLIKMYPAAQDEWCRDWFRGWVDFVRADCTGRAVEEFDICVDGTTFIGFEASDIETLRSIGLVLKAMTGRVVSEISTSKRNTFNIVTKEAK